jgi:hypothetical protein
VSIPDPWSGFGLANDLLTGEWLAGHALENLQAGRRNAVDSPTSPETCPVLASPIAASLNALFDPAVAQPGFFASQPQLQRSLRAAIGDCQGNNSPFPSTGDKAILTRV